MNTSHKHERALTLIDVLVVFALFAVIAALVLPAVLPRRGCRSTPRSRCMNNLRQVGLAFRIYANDHDEKFPWQTSKTNGGTAHLTESSRVFEHFLAASNELVTSKILSCNSDGAKQRANDFSTFSNTNLSYFVGIEAENDNSYAMLAGDRHVSGGVLSNGFMRVYRPGAQASWTTELHTNEGNVVFGDGHAELLSSAQLAKSISNQLESVTPVRLAIP